MSLRVSIGTFVRVVLAHPHGGAPMLALERKATGLETGAEPRIFVRAQPFGGAVRLRSLAPLEALIGAVEFDSERSRAEQDFRLLIRPAAWGAVRQFCWEHLADNDPLIDSDPARELAEEFSDALAIDLQPEQYQARPIGLVVEDQPTPTQNPRATGVPTVRIGRVFEARIVDDALAGAMLANSERYSDRDLHDQALADWRRGGRGRANAVLALPLERLTETYQSLSFAARAAPIVFEGHQLDNNVPAILDGVATPHYVRL